MPGWGAYVPQVEYQNHIANYLDEPEVSHHHIYFDDYELMGFTARVIHASHNMMHWFMPALNQQPDMLSLVPFWLFAQDTV